jgi:hypothetical protein
MESTQATLPGRLAVILKNVRAVREVYDYIAGGDIEEDLISAQQALVRHLCQSLQIPDGWRRPYLEDGNIRLHPDKKWNVPGGDTIAISVCVPSPAAEEDEDEDRDASVNLYVPSSWKLQERFTSSLRSIVPKAEDWVYVRDEPDEINPEYPMGKWIRYGEYAGSTGFDAAGFFQAITGAVSEFLQLETEIDRLFEGAKAMSAAFPRKQSGSQTRRERKAR